MMAVFSLSTMATGAADLSARIPFIAVVLLIQDKALPNQRCDFGTYPNTFAGRLDGHDTFMLFEKLPGKLI